MHRHHLWEGLKAARSRAQHGLGLLALVLLFGQPPTAQAACDPSVSCCAGAPSTGSPCGGAGAATLGNTSGVDSGAGIAIPSVVPGRERITRIAYNAAMQPVEVVEEGFSPVDEQGRFAPQGTPIRRSTRYGYAQINGRSVLSSVDGPLPNGPTSRPEDSDITRYEWDARADYLQRIVRPGPRTLDVQREPESGRIVGVTGPDGVNVPLPQATRGNAGLSDNADLNGNAGLSGRADLRIEHDPWARPVAWRTASGAAAGTNSEALLSATWGPPGSVAESSVLGFATPHAQAQRRLDDFARVVAIRHPGQGWQFARHDEAGRLLETIDPRGARQRARWDLAGRLVRLERFAPGAEAGTTAEQVIDRRYEHERLIEERLSDRQGQRITRLSYDERGALASETLRIEPAGALRAALPEPIQLSLAYRREAGGRLSRTLTGADGRRLSIDQENVAGRVARIRTEGALPAWLGGGRDIVRDIRWQDLGALRYATAIAHGDGRRRARRRPVAPHPPTPALRRPGPRRRQRPELPRRALLRADTRPLHQPRPSRQANLNEEEKKALGLIDAQGQDTGLRQRLDQALQHAVYVLGGTYKGKRIVGWRTRLTANTPIDPASDSQVQQFANETGFSHTPGSTSSEAYGMYVRMVKWAKMAKLMERYLIDGGGNSKVAYDLLHKEAQSQLQEGVSPTVEQRFDALLVDLGMTREGFGLYLRARRWNEGWQGFATAAIFTDKTLRAILVDGPNALFKSQQKFDLISDREIRWKYAAYRIKYPDETEEDIVARIGYFHNAGSDAKALSVARNFEYAKGLVGIWSNTAKMPCDVMNVPRLVLDPIKPKS